MREVDDFLQKESTKLSRLLQDVQQNRRAPGRPRECFGSRATDAPRQPKRSGYFKKHPRHISSSSSEVIDRSTYELDDQKLSVRWKSGTSSEEPKSKSHSSLDLVTVRREINVISGRRLRKGFNSVAAFDGYGEDGGKRFVKPRCAEVGERSVDSCPKKPKKPPALEKRRNLDRNEPPNEIVIDAKLNNVLAKTLKCMEDIRMQIDASVVLPDGDEDLDRRKKRSIEFASRFSRNYLYQLNRQVNDIGQITSQRDGNISSRTSLNIRQKLIASYQTLLQGLQAYYNHLPVAVTNAAPDKVRELLKLTSSICDIHRTCTGKDLNYNDDEQKIIDVFEVRSKCLLEKINERYFYASTTTLMQEGRPDTFRRKQKRQQTPKNRYSMYSMSQVKQDEAWRKVCASLAKKKFNVPSKYKTASFKHRPPMEKQVPIAPPSTSKSSKLVEKKSSGKMKAKSCLNDDDIQTLVQFHSDRGSEVCLDSTNQAKNANSDSNVPSENHKAGNEQECIASLIGRVVAGLKDQNKELNQHQIKNILQGFLEYVGGAQNHQQQQAEREREAKDQKEPCQRERQKEPRRCEGENRHKEENAGDKELKWWDAAKFDASLLEKVVETLERNQESIKKAKEVCGENVAAQEKAKPQRKKSVTVTGAKNAQLICIKDEDSVADEPSDEGDAAASNLVLESKLSKHSKSDSASSGAPSKSSEDRATTSWRPQNACPPSKVKISRLPRGPLRQLKMLPKRTALEALEYKMAFARSKKGNHMYKKSATKQPWTLMGEIADKILDELLQEVGSEIQVNGVIDSIYASEFAQ